MANTVNGAVIVMVVLVVVMATCTQATTVKVRDGDEEHHGSLVDLRRTSDEQELVVTSAVAVVGFGVKVFSYIQQANNWLMVRAANRELKSRRRELEQNMQRWKSDLDYVYGSYQTSCSRPGSTRALETKFNRYPVDLVRRIFKDSCQSLVSAIVKLPVSSVVSSVMGIAGSLMEVVSMIRKRAAHRKHMKAMDSHIDQVIRDNNDLANDVVGMFRQFDSERRSRSMSVSRSVQQVVNKYLNARRAMNHIETYNNRPYKTEYQKKVEDRRAYNQQGGLTPLARRFRRHSRENAERQNQHRMRNEVKGIFQGRWDRPKRRSLYQKFNDMMMV